MNCLIDTSTRAVLHPHPAYSSIGEMLHRCIRKHEPAIDGYSVTDSTGRPICGFVPNSGQVQPLVLLDHLRVPTPDLWQGLADDIQRIRTGKT